MARSLDPRKFPRFDRATVNAAIGAVLEGEMPEDGITDAEFLEVMDLCRASYERRRILLVSVGALTRIEMMCYASAQSATNRKRMQQIALTRAAWEVLSDR
jgi:hypothetical protein